MKKDLTELFFIMDKSGSMESMVSDTIGGYNAFLEKQRKEEGQALVTTVLFNTNYSTVHDRIDINQVPQMTENDYIPFGGTALLDAVGEGIRHVSEIHKYIREEDVPEQTIFVIMTDGYENSSRKYDNAQIKNMVNEKQNLGWKFMFLGADIDAFSLADIYGFDRRNVASYRLNEKGMNAMYNTVSDRISRIRRQECSIRENDLQEDINNAYEEKNK